MECTNRFDLSDCSSSLSDHQLNAYFVGPLLIFGPWALIGMLSMILLKVCVAFKLLRVEAAKNSKGTNELYRTTETESEDLKSFIELDDIDISNVKDVICSECEKWDIETRIQFCDSCLTQKFESVENYFGIARLGGAQFDSIAICAVCAIRNHMKKGHDVDEFYPILRKFQFEDFCENLKPKRMDYQLKTEELKQKLEKMMAVIGEGEKQLNQMTEMMRKSRSSALQEIALNKLTQQTERNSKYVKRFSDAVVIYGGRITTIISDLKEENDILDAKNYD